MKYLKLFKTDVDYQNYIESDDCIKPNVSYAQDTDNLYYNPRIDENPIILTHESNPAVLDICYYQGWAASPDEMHKSEAEKVTDVSDMLIQTQNLGKTTVDELSSSMGKVIPTANSMNVGLDNLCASYSIMTAKGIATAESTTYINSMLNELGKSSTTVGGIIKDKTGMSFQECMASGMSLGDVLQILQN